MEILRSTSYGDPDRAETGIERLLSEEYFTAAYPLHDVTISNETSFLFFLIYDETYNGIQASYCDMLLP